MLQNAKKETIVILDTNILVSYLWGSAHCLRIIRAMLLENRFIPAVTSEMIDEFDDVLSRPHLKRRIGEITPAVFKREYLLFAQMVHPRKCITICEDPEDNMMLECADAAGADFIVTGDAHLLKIERFGKAQIVTPVEFIRCFID